MSQLQIIYVSQPFGFDEAMLIGILMDARRKPTPAGGLIASDTSS